MFIKKLAIAPALIALSVAVTSLAVFAGPSGGDKNGGDHGGGGGKNGGGGHHGGDGKNGGHGGKNGDGGRREGKSTSSEGDRCSAYRTSFNYRHCLRHKRYVRARMVPCLRGDAIVYDYGCGRRVIVRRARPVYDAPDYGYSDEQVVVRRSYRRLARRDRIRQRRVVVADIGGYGYDNGYGGMSRAARMQQERRLRKRLRARAEYSYSYGNAYYDDHGYAPRRLKHRKHRRRHMVDYGYGYGSYDPGMRVHYGPTILKNGAY